MTESVTEFASTILHLDVDSVDSVLHPVSKKLCKNVFVTSSSYVYQLYFHNFWHTDSTKDRFMRGALIFHLT